MWAGEDEVQLKIVESIAKAEYSCRQPASWSAEANNFSSGKSLCTEEGFLLWDYYFSLSMTKCLKLGSRNTSGKLSAPKRLRDVLWVKWQAMFSALYIRATIAPTSFAE